MKWSTDWDDRSKVYIPMNFKANPDDSGESRFEKLNDFGWVYLFAKFSEEMTTDELMANLKSDSCRSGLAKVLANPEISDSQKAAEFSRLVNYSLIKTLTDYYQRKYYLFCSITLY